MRKCILILGLFIFLNFSIFCLQVFAKSYDYINVNNPSSRKIPVALPDFKAFNKSIQEKRDGKKARILLRESLDFLGYLKTMNPISFLSNPSETGIGLSEIEFADWISIGAELLITGGISYDNGLLRFELRLIDVFNAELLVGKVYTGTRLQVRKMILLFCDEISYKLTGRWGIFNSRIAFVSSIPDGKEIFTCDFDGKEIRQETFHNSISLSPSWSSDSEWLAYVSYKNGKPDIFIINLNDKIGSIIDKKGMSISPDWMPGNLILAASLSFSGDQEIYLLTKKGEIIKRITKNLGIDVSPQFSPDGKKIVFTSKRTGQPQLYVQDIDLNRVERLTFEGEYNTSPAWSPDGSKIAYVSMNKRNTNIYVMDFKTKDIAQLTRNSKENESPAWAPDGSMIVFASNRDQDVFKLFVMNASGSDQRKLLDFHGNQSQPDWSMSRYIDR